jgi:hypothetical protein
MKHKLLKFNLALFASLIIAGSLNAQCTAATPTASNTTVNCGGTATLTATGSVGYQWWDQSSGGTLLGSNATYTTPALTANTSYFVEGEDNSPQAMMGLPAHNSPFSGNVRGYYFVAPVNFTITGLKEPVEVSGLQNIAVVRLNATPPLYSTVTNSFTQLFLTQNDPTVGIIPVNIPVMAGDIIGILGQAGGTNSYSTAAASFATTIGGQPVNIARLGMQYPLATNVPHDLWTEASGSISRVEMYYTLPCTPSPRVQVDVTIVPIAVSATAVNTDICVGLSTTLNATGATNYTWMPGNMTGSSISVTPATTTTYTVTGDDPSGCSNTATVTVNVNPIPTITATAASSNICMGSSDVLTASGGLTYSWSSGGTASTETVSPTSMTTYTVTGTDAIGCSNTATVMVMVDPLPTVVANSTASVVCAGTSVTLTGSGAVSYTWDNSVTDGISFVPAATTTYMVTGTDANGCMNTDMTTVTVNPLPTVVANSTSAAVCAGSSVTLTGSGAVSYTWDNSVTDGVSFVPVATTTYMVTGTDANGCMNTDMTTVTVNALPTVALGADVTQCGGTITLDAQNAGSTYLWSNASTTQTISVSSTGNYFVDVTDANGCAGSDTVMVTINTPPTVSGTATATTACLSDAAITLTGTPAGGTWSGPGVTGSSFSPATAGVGAQTATYNFTDVNGCSGSAGVVITVNACVGVAEQTLENGITIFPNPNNGTFTIAVDANVGDLVVVITDMQGRVVYSSTENNVQAGFAKQINLETESSGLYLMQVTANGKQFTQKISVQR